MRIPLPQSVKKSIKRFLISPAGSFLAARHAGISTCLNYHRVASEIYVPGTFDPNIWLSVHKDAFEEQVRFISEHCVCLTLAESVKLLTAKKLPVNSVTITFDDGYKDNLTLALPILEKYGVPATVFVTTGLIDRTASLWWEEHTFILERINSLKFTWRGEEYNWQLDTVAQKDMVASELRIIFKQLNLMEQQELLEILRDSCPDRFDYHDLIMSWDELSELDRHPLIDIGAHTNSHPILARLTSEELREELSGSKRILEAHLKHEVPLTAYPIGQREHASVREFDAARDAGFAAAFTSRPAHMHFEHGQHLYSLPRIPVDYFDTIESLRWKLSGFEALVQRPGSTFVTD